MDLKLEWNIVCRICLCDGDMFSLFTCMENSNISYKDKITQTTNLEIKPNSNLPEQICSKCVADLEVAFHFRMNCESSEAILNSYIQSQENCPDKMESFKAELDSEPDSNFTTTDYIEELEPDESTNIEFLDNIGLSFESRVYSVNDDDDVIHEAVYLKDAQDLIDQEVIDLIDDPTQDLPMSEEFIMPMIEEINNVVQISMKPKKPAKAKVRKPKPTTTDIENKTEKEQTRSGGAVDLNKNICEICGNNYKYKHALQIHMRRHQGIKPHACEVCGMKFVIPFELKRHQRVHSGAKPYGCKFCDRHFSDFGSRIKHERSHTGERPYKCLQCTKTFAYSHVLTSHMLVHSGEKKYECQQCGKFFAKNHHLKQHMNVHLKVRTNNDGAASILNLANNRRKKPLPMMSDISAAQQSEFIEIYENGNSQGAVHQLYHTSTEPNFEEEDALLRVVNKMTAEQCDDDEDDDYEGIVG